MTIIAALAVKRRLENLLSDSKDQLRDALRFTFSEKVRLLIKECRKVITENHQVWILICMEENPKKIWTIQEKCQWLWKLRKATLQRRTPHLKLNRIYQSVVLSNSVFCLAMFLKKGCTPHFRSLRNRRPYHRMPQSWHYSTHQCPHSCYPSEG